MSPAKSATEAKIRDLNRRLAAETDAHARTRNELQQEIRRVWTLVPSNTVNLMGVFPPLRKLLNTLGQLADVEDPSRSSPIEDTMRVDYVAVGEHASTSSTERAATTHARPRDNVRFANQDVEHLHNRILREVEYVADRLARMPGVDQSEINPPTGVCECGCGRLIFQKDDGRRRRFHSAACRKRASRSVEV